MTTSARTHRTNRAGLAVGALALAVACSGGAYAAGAAITSSAQIKQGVVNSGDLKNGSVKVKDLNQKTVAALEPAIDGWTTVGSFSGAWGPFPGYTAPAFRVDDRTGEVSLRGAATRGADSGSGSVIFTLPAGHRPANPVALRVATTDGLGGEDADGMVIIQTSGNVTFLDDGDDRFVSLEGVSFYLG
jgi:hypothetical protein